VTLGAPQLAGLTGTLAQHYADWSALITPDPDRRVYRQIWDHPSANAWMIAWCPGQDTGWHDHDDAGAAITALHGEVFEERMQLGGGTVSRLIAAGQVFHVPATAIHRVRHAGTDAAVTVHCYSPPLQRQGSYSVGPSGELLRTAQSLEQELRAEPALI
jgi:quercetin dioxygenase-like cupin family protein